MTVGHPPSTSRKRRRGRLGALAPWTVAAVAAAGWWRAHNRLPPPLDAAQETSSLSHPVVGDPAHFETEEPRRGRLASSPRAIPLRGWRDILWRTLREVGEDRLTVVAASVTYYTLLAVFPAVGVFVSLYGLVADVAAVREQLDALSSVFPPDILRLVGEQMMRLATRETAGLTFAFAISLFFSLWSASASMRSLFDGLNIAYDETEKRGFLTLAAITYGFTAALLVFLSLVSAILVAAPLVLEALNLRSELMIAARWPLVFVVAMVAFVIAYRYGPSRARARWRWLMPGAAFAALVWMGGSAGFSWYLTDVARLDVTYGSLGAVIGFMLWVWLSVMVVLIGAELNAEIEHQTALDSTTGPPAPMGRRGAVMADTVGLRFAGLRAGLGRIRAGARTRFDQVMRSRKA